MEQNNYFSFDIIHKSTKSDARVGVISTPHGYIQTPGFVPVATNGSIKSIDSFLLEKLDLDLIFCNTYHLLLHPGPDVIQDGGGLHNFMRRNKPIITDSGGFQVFSLMYGGVTEEIKSKGKKNHKNSVLKINEEGALFRSYRNGEKILLTPEFSVSIQKKLAADIIIPLDELLPYHTDAKALKKSFLRTHRWQERSFAEHLKDKKKQAMYAVVHGGLDKELRKQSANILSKFSYDGFSIGGSLGVNSFDLKSVLEATIKWLPNNYPRHLLGIGDTPSISEGVFHGIDTFDSSYPTKCARHGLLFNNLKNIKIEQSKWKNCHERISEAPLVKEYTAAYIHHLFKSGEQLGGILASIHNLWYMADYMKKVRDKIINNEI